jgi:hypothetical protein
MESKETDMADDLEWESLEMLRILKEHGPDTTPGLTNLRWPDCVDDDDPEDPNLFYARCDDAKDLLVELLGKTLVSETVIVCDCPHCGNVLVSGWELTAAGVDVLENARAAGLV